MTSSEVIELIANTNRINADHTDELEMLVNRYPWFAAGHMLLAKAHKNAGRHSYKNLLKKASLYAGDRSLLLRLMEDPEKQVEEKAPEQEPAVHAQPDQNGDRDLQKDPPVETVQEAETTGAGRSGNAIEEFLRSFGGGDDRKVQEEKQPELPEEDEVTAENGTREEEERQEPLEEQILDELHHIQPEEGLASDSADTDEGEDEPILQDIPFRTSHDAEVETGEEEDQETEEARDEESYEDIRRTEIIYDPVKELGKLAGVNEEEEGTGGDEGVPFVPVYDPEVELAAIAGKQDEEEDTEIVEDDDHHSFLNWLDEFSTGSHKTGEKQSKKSAGTKKEKQSAPKKADASELLDTFLKKKPRISRMKAEFYNPETMARKSETDDSDIVSETLARLLLKQGHAEKAIEVYEKLKLQMPTNLAYFAARITEIKEEYNIG